MTPSNQKRNLRSPAKGKPKRDHPKLLLEKCDISIYTIS